MRARERHVDEQLGLLVLVVVVSLFAFVCSAIGWAGRGFYEDHVARQTLKHLCETGVLCAELAE